MKIDIPFDLNAESIVIGSVLAVPSCADRFFSECDPSHFHDARNVIIFHALKHFWKNEYPINAHSLAMHLQESGKIGEAGGLDYLISLDYLALSVDVSPYYDKLQEVAKLRKLKRMALAICASERDSKELIELAGKELTSIATDKTEKSRPLGDAWSNFKNGGSISQYAADRMKMRASGSEPLEGPSTGYKKLDSYLGGLAPGRLVVLGARPGCGKSEFVCQISAKLAGSGIPIMIFSMEMSFEEWALRCIAIKTGVSHGRIMRGQITAEEYNRIQYAEKTHKELVDRVIIDPTPGRSLIQLKSILRHAIEKYGVQVAFVDHLGLIEEKGASRYEKITQISRELKNIAKELNVCVFSLSQLNRESEKRNSSGGAPKPLLSDLRDSGSVEQDADQVILLDRPDALDRNNQPGKVILTIAKNRHGEQGRVDFHFDRDQQLLSEIDYTNLGHIEDFESEMEFQNLNNHIQG